MTTHGAGYSNTMNNTPEPVDLNTVERAVAKRRRKAGLDDAATRDRSQTHNEPSSDEPEADYDEVLRHRAP
jgi:hypothetical protein